MNVETILRGKGSAVATIRPDETVGAAVKELISRNVGALVVSEDGETVDGIISERDIVRLLDEKGATALGAPVAEVMTRKVVTCDRNETIGEIMERITTGRFRHVPVIEHGRLAGIVSIGDVVKARLSELEREQDALREYIRTA